MPDLNLDGLPKLNWMLRRDPDRFLRPEHTAAIEGELRQLVERERQDEGSRNCDECYGNGLEDGRDQLPAWAKPVMKAAVGSVDVPEGTTGAEWDDAIINAVDALTPEQREEIMRDD